jgi:ectoine hydroxylase-related dioxygenase (phytanoyl-CoA dioxygenase family)
LTVAGLNDFRNNAQKLAGVDTSKAIEVPANEGDLIVFNPMALHSASGNASDTPRYVYFASFMDVSAKRLDEELTKTNYRSNFPDSLRAGLPADLKNMLN